MSELASVARVAFEATGLADFAADNARAEASYRSSVGGMSDEAIKFRLAQDRLQRTLQKGPSAYREQARAEIALRNAERQLRGETDSLTRSQERNRRGIVGLRGSLVGLAASYIGAQGIINLTRASVNAARDEELVMGQTRVAIEARGEAYDRIAPKLARQIRLVQRLGFDDEELAKSFQTLSGSAGSLEEAMAQLNLVAGVARGRYIDLESATQVVNKANLGMSGALRRIGIDVDKNASRVQLLTALNERYGRSAVEAADSGAAAADRFSVAIEETQESIGRGLAPTVADLSDRVTKWLSVAENQEELQRRVNQAVKTGESVVSGFLAVVDRVEPVAGRAADALGGLDRAVETLLVLGILRKSQRALAGLRGLATGFGLVGAAALRAEATSSRALTGIGVSATAAQTKVTGLRGSLLGLGGLGSIAVSIGLTQAGQEVPSGGGEPGTVTTLGDTAGLLRLARAGKLSIETIRRLEAEGKIAPKVADKLARATPGAWPSGPGGPGGLTPRPSSRPPRAPSTRPRTITDILLDEARAGTTAGTSDDLRFKRERRDRVQRQIDELERRKNLTKQQKERLAQLYGELAGVQGEIEALVDAGEERIAEQKAAAASKRAAKRAAEQARLGRILDAAERQAERRGDLFARAGIRGAWNAGSMREAALRGVKPTLDALAKSEKPLTKADVREAILDALKQTNALREFGSNFAEGSAAERTATHASAQTDILMEQNRKLDRMVADGWHPGARAAAAEFSVIGTGVAY